LKRNNNRPSAVFSVSILPIPGIFSAILNQYRVESLGVLPFHELDDIAQIIAVDIQVFLRICKRKPTRGIRCEIAEIPTFDKVAEGRDARMLFECT